MMKKAVVNVQSVDNVFCVVTALHPVERKSEWESSYPYYTTVLKLKHIEFPMTLIKLKNLKIKTTFPSTRTASKRKRNSRFGSPIKK